ncbi:homoserine kinase [Candidatus Pyrohabitans sp.]
MIKVVSPATSANLGPGFDVFGLALSSPSDEMGFREIEEGVRIKARGYPVPEGSEENIAGYVASRVLSANGIKRGVEISINKRIRLKSGLGSSAASAAGAAYGLNELFNLGMSREEILKFALQGEKHFSGAEHADNIAACLYGGFTCVSYSPLRVLSITPPEFLEYAVILPEVEVETRLAREMLPESLPLATHVRNLSSAVLFVAGMLRGDGEAIGAGMRDYFATPVRSRNIPLFGELRSAALGAGALGFAISGSGPACIALCDSTEIAGRELAGVLREVYDDHGMECTTYAGKPGKGLKIMRIDSYNER